MKTDELPNPRPTQPKKNRLKVVIWGATFFPQEILLSWVGILILYRKQTTRYKKPNLTKLSANTQMVDTRFCSYA